jgi:putative ATP-binding cassette transporter
MTARYLDDWLEGANHYRMQLLGDAADNPDQRIADDIRLFIELTLTLGVGFLSSVVTLASFATILWTLSAAAPLHLFGVSYDIPGYLFWIALVYAIVGTALTHLIGRPLIPLNFQQQRYEADFRFNLVRTRENSEQIALLDGEPAETARLLDRFGHVVRNWHGIMIRQKKLTFLTAGYGQISLIFPLIVVSPAYFAGAIQLGGMMQTASAYTSVQGALSFFVTAYPQLAQWRAVIDRLDGFNRAVATAQAAAVTPPRVELETGDAPEIAVDDLALHLPQGTPLVTVADLSFKTGDRALVTGPSGSGKSTLFRALAGIWPFGSGRVRVPKGASVMMLPQRPYFPIGSLAAAVAYPAPPNTYDAATVAEAIAAAGLPGLAGRIEEEAHWNRMLSLGEQQRLGLARALLHRPDYLFLDEATASLDEASEADLYRLLEKRLPGTTLVSIGHRSTLGEFHNRRLTLSRDGAAFVLAETANPPR